MTGGSYLSFGFVCIFILLFTSCFIADYHHDGHGAFRSRNSCFIPPKCFTVVLLLPPALNAPENIVSAPRYGKQQRENGKLKTNPLFRNESGKGGGVDD